MKKIFDCGYTDKFSYTNKEDIILYLNGTNDNKNVKLYIKDLNGEIVKELLVPEIKNYFTLENRFIPRYNDNRINLTPWIDFDLKPCMTFNMNNFKSGIYLIHDNKEEKPSENNSRNKVVFIIKELPAHGTVGRALITYIMPTNTDMMYNYYGGKSGYYDWKTLRYVNPNGPSKILGVKRPTNILREHHFSLLKWLHNEEYKINYICDSDCDFKENLYWTDANTGQTKLIIIGGHSEYWSEKSRINLDYVLSKGVNLLCLSGNTMWTRISYTDNYDKLICIRNDNELKYLPAKYHNKLSKRTKNFIDEKISNNSSELRNIYSSKNETIMDRWYTFLTLGTDYLYGGHGLTSLKPGEWETLPTHINKYYTVNKSFDFESIAFFSIGEEYDGISTNFVECDDLVKTPFCYLEDKNKFILFNNYNCEKIKNFKNNVNKIKLSSLYKNYFYSEILMLGLCFYPTRTPGNTRTTGIIKLQKTKTSGTIINCCNSTWGAYFDRTYIEKLRTKNGFRPVHIKKAYGFNGWAGATCAEFADGKPCSTSASPQEDYMELIDTVKNVKNITKKFINDLLM